MQLGGGLGISDPTNGEGSPPTSNKYARRGNIAFIGGGAVLVIRPWIVGGLAYFDAFHTSPPKSVGGKPTSPPVAEKPSPPAVAEKPTPVPPAVCREVTPKVQRQWNCLRIHLQNQHPLVRQQTIRRSRQSHYRRPNHSHHQARQRSLRRSPVLRHKPVSLAICAKLMRARHPLRTRTRSILPPVG
jgi:hypothetical protein